MNTDTPAQSTLMTRRFNAAHLAAAWLSVALASGTDDETPALYRTVCVEIFDHGICLVASDSYFILYAWVPNHEATEAAPGLDETPNSQLVARDLHGRAKSLMGHLLKLTQADDAPTILVDLTVGPMATEPGNVLPLRGLSEQVIVLEHPSHEQVALGLYEGPFAAWRPVILGHQPEQTDAIKLNPEILGRLAKLGKLWNGQPLVWKFGGTNKMARLRVGEPEDPYIEGGVMPVTTKQDDAKDDE